ncbi:P-loop domain-containing protein [cyanobacterium endosymbiont of Rhopalodia gibberula]|nr:P-loop domain-containing protein [cyanobacterium endosymbiont of Rhopalodia gibberula]
MSVSQGTILIVGGNYRGRLTLLRTVGSGVYHPIIGDR